MLHAKVIVMNIGLQTARELRANELDLVSGGGGIYLGNGDGFFRGRLPSPHTPPAPINPPTGGGSGGSGNSGSGHGGFQPPPGGGGFYLY